MITVTEMHAIDTLRRLHTNHPGYRAFRAMFIGQSNAATCRRSLIEKGLVEVFKHGRINAYALTQKARDEY